MPEPTEPSPEQPILSFEEFTAGARVGPRYGNFAMYFDRGEGNTYRNESHYQRFTREHLDLATSLCDKIQNHRVRGTSESLKPFERDLYEAYKIMRSYGVSDQDLFA